MDLNTLQRELGEWADETFPGETYINNVTHLRREIEELAANPTDPIEAADCAMLLLVIAHRQGYSLLEAIREKQQINQAREWGPPDAEGVREHVR